MRYFRSNVIAICVGVDEVFSVATCWYVVLSNTSTWLRS
jgi:hypothetical protein